MSELQVPLRRSKLGINSAKDLVYTVYYPALFMVGENFRHSVPSEEASLEESGHGSTQVRPLVHVHRDLRFARWLP
jgi:hypothetical protein